MKGLVSGFEQKDIYGRTLKTYLPSVQAISGSLNFYSLASYCTYLNVSPSSLQPPVEIAYGERDRTVAHRKHTIPQSPDRYASKDLKSWILKKDGKKIFYSGSSEKKNPLELGYQDFSFDPFFNPCWQDCTPQLTLILSN